MQQQIRRTILLNNYLAGVHMKANVVAALREEFIKVYAQNLKPVNRLNDDKNSQTRSPEKLYWRDNPTAWCLLAGAFTLGFSYMAYAIMELVAK